MEKFLTLLTPPATEPITFADALDFMRAEDTDTAQIDAFIQVARETVENMTGRALISQTWVYTASHWNEYFDSLRYHRPDSNCFKARTIKLEKSPLVSVTTVKYWPLVGSVQVTLSSSAYIVQSGIDPGRIVLKADESWPDLADRPDAVEIEFVAGYADAASIPSVLKHCVKLLAANFYTERVPVNVGNIVNELPLNLKMLIESQRVGGWHA